MSGHGAVGGAEVNVHTSPAPRNTSLFLERRLGLSSAPFSPVASMDYERYDRVRAVTWTGEALDLLDQRVLPMHQTRMICHDVGQVAQAIFDLVVRGAPAIGIAAAWGLVLASRRIQAKDGPEARAALTDATRTLNAARPTAVNLAWALRRMNAALGNAGDDWRAILANQALAIEQEDLAANRHMGRLGAALIEPGSGVLTHCNTGSLATSGFGTALGEIRAGVAEGRVGASLPAKPGPGCRERD